MMHYGVEFVLRSCPFSIAAHCAAKVATSSVWKPFFMPSCLVVVFSYAQRSLQGMHAVHTGIAGVASSDALRFKVGIKWDILIIELHAKWCRLLP